MKKEPLIILTGPTAVGKTELSIALAKAVNGEIISADSMQVYRYMDIGTAKITKEEMQGVKHYLVDEIEPSDGFDVARLKTMAVDAIQKIRENGHIPVVVGGTDFIYRHFYMILHLKMMKVTMNIGIIFRGLLILRVQRCFMIC